MESLPYYPANIYCFPRRLQRNNSRLPRPLEDVFKTYLQYVFLKRLQDVLQDVFKTFSRRLEDVFKTSWRRVCKRSCDYVFKTSWKTKKCYWRRLQYVFTKTNVCWMFASSLLMHHWTWNYNTLFPGCDFYDENQDILINDWENID